jgi:hypothetical protein
LVDELPLLPPIRRTAPDVNEDPVSIKPIVPTSSFISEPRPPCALEPAVRAACTQPTI